MTINVKVSEEENENETDSTVNVIIGCGIIVVLMFLAVIGNSLTCLITCKKPSFRTPSNISIALLSVSDILMAVFVMPFSLVSFIKGEWLFSSDACTLSVFLI